MVVSCQELYKKFRDWLILESHLSWRVSHEIWTQKIKEYLGSLAEEESCQAIYTKKGEESEFLLDMVWLVKRPRKLLELGMEIELSGTRKRYLKAFDKLLHVKANVKAGIFLLKTKRMDEIIKVLRQKVIEVQFPLPKEEYLVILLNYDGAKKEINIAGYQIFAWGDKTELGKDAYPFPE